MGEIETVELRWTRPTGEVAVKVVFLYPTPEAASDVIEACLEACVNVVEAYRLAGLTK